MVKLGSLYRGPQDAPLSHRIRNIPTAPTSNYNANPSAARQLQNSSREQLSKYQRAQVQVSSVLQLIDKVIRTLESKVF